VWAQIGSEIERTLERKGSFGHSIENALRGSGSVALAKQFPNTDTW
jgi:hypothetical protein